MPSTRGAGPGRRWFRRFTGSRKLHSLRRCHSPSMTVRGSTTLPKLLLIFWFFSSMTKP